MIPVHLTVMLTHWRICFSKQTHTHAASGLYTLNITLPTYAAAVRRHIVPPSLCRHSSIHAPRHMQQISTKVKKDEQSSSPASLIYEHTCYSHSLLNKNFVGTTGSGIKTRLETVCFLMQFVVCLFGCVHEYFAILEDQDSPLPSLLDH